MSNRRPLPVSGLAARFALLLICSGCAWGLDSAKYSKTPEKIGEGAEPVAASAPIADLENAKPTILQTSAAQAVTETRPPPHQLPSAAPTLVLATSPRRPLALQEALWLSLRKSDLIRTLSGSVRIEPVTTLDTMIARSEIQKEEARFDPRLSANYEGSQINQPPDAFFGPGISTNTRRDEGNFGTRLDKLWEWGTTTRLAYEPSLGYLFFPQGSSSTYNPAYSSALVLDVRQPLYRAAGWKVNTAPIRIAGARAGQTEWDVQQAAQAQVRSVMEAYWRLHAALFAWQAIDGLLPLVEETVRIEELRYQSQRSIYADVARASSSLEALRRQRAQAELSVRQAEFNMRQLMGLPASDGAVLVPVDMPYGARIEPNIEQLVQTAHQRRPDLNRRRARRDEQDWKLVVAQNGVLPQLDLRALYRTNGLDSRLDDSLDQMSAFQYTDWTLGVEFSMPLGNRRAKADLQAAELQLMRELALIRGFEEQVTFDFLSLAAELRATWESYESSARQVQHAQEWLRLSRIRYSAPPAANRGDDWLLIALYDYQNSMQAWINAVTASSRNLADYNILLTRIDEAQGTLLDVYQISVAGSPPPQAGQVETTAGPDALPSPGYAVGQPGPVQSASYHQNSVRR